MNHSMLSRSSLIVALLVFIAAGRSGVADDRPNVLFLFADDQCFETIHALGNSEIETPNLDRLVRRGTTFSHCYNMGSWSGAVCVASRTMLNSGRKIWSAHEIYNQSEQERRAGRWWSEHLKQAGYRTYMTGKWHVKANANAAFDVTGHVRAGMPNQTPAGYNRPVAGQTDAWSPYDTQFGGFWAGGTHWSEVVGDEAIAFLQEADGIENPYFMYVAFNAPHDPRQSPKSYVDKYPLDKISVPSNYQPDYPFMNGIGCGPGLRDEQLAPFPRTEFAVKTHRQEYYAIITHMDAQIGRILDALEASSKHENTWIFFTADHGLAVGQHGLMGKQNMYDHSIRVPFMVVGPDIPAGETIDEPIYLQDVMPTTLELAGVARPEHVQFQNLLPVLQGEKTKHGAIYGAYLNLQRMVRTENWKLILYPQIKKFRLYDLQNDPQEANDVAGDPGQAGTARELFATFRELQAELQDPLDVTDAFPELVDR